MTTHLQPCPCCGSAAAFLEAVPDGWIITCTGETPCIATAEIRCTRGEDPRPEMAKQWNTRHPAQTEQQHPDDAAVDRFAAAMKVKLAASRAKGRGGWDDPNVCCVEFLAQLLVEHLDKGNAGTFEDVANFAMMLHQRGADPKVLAEAAEAPIRKARGEALELGVRALESKTAPQPEQSGPIEEFLTEVRAELIRARTKFPGDRIMTIALAEEFGELCKAVLDESAANVRKEAVQTAVMAARVALDGDSSVCEWRHERGLDPLPTGSPEGLLRSAQGGAE